MRDSGYRAPLRSESYRFRLHRNDLTAEGAEKAEGENTEMNNSDATGFDITPARGVSIRQQFLITVSRQKSV